MILIEEAIGAWCFSSAEPPRHDCAREPIAPSSEKQLKVPDRSKPANSIRQIANLCFSAAFRAYRAMGMELPLSPPIVRFSAQVMILRKHARSADAEFHGKAPLHPLSNATSSALS